MSRWPIQQPLSTPRGMPGGEGATLTSAWPPPWPSAGSPPPRLCRCCCLLLQLDRQRVSPHLRETAQASARLFSTRPVLIPTTLSPSRPSLADGGECFTPTPQSETTPILHPSFLRLQPLATKGATGRNAPLAEASTSKTSALTAPRWILTSQRPSLPSFPLSLCFPGHHPFCGLRLIQTAISRESVASASLPFGQR